MAWAWAWTITTPLFVVFLIVMGEKASVSTIVFWTVLWVFSLVAGVAGFVKEYLDEGDRLHALDRFQKLWESKVREAYNSVAIGMTVEEVNKIFNTAKESIVFQDGIETHEILHGRKKLLAEAAIQIKRKVESKFIPNLISEETLPSGVIKSVYRWDLNIGYITSQTDASGVGTTLGVGTTPGSSASQVYGFANRQNTHSTTTEKAYIQITFEDGKMVKREQKGLFEI